MDKLNSEAAEEVGDKQGAECRSGEHQAAGELQDADKEAVSATREADSAVDETVADAYFRGS